jgi:hypothetical protein
LLDARCDVQYLHHGVTNTRKTGASLPVGEGRCENDSVKRNAHKRTIAPSAFGVGRALRALRPAHGVQLRVSQFAQRGHLRRQQVRWCSCEPVSHSKRSMLRKELSLRGSPWLQK